jgi:hypothetical protein
MMGRVHITATELEVMPSAVAAIAIIGAYFGVRSASRSQVRLAQLTNNRDRLTETYIDLLRGVHLRNAQLDDTYSRPIHKASRTPTRSEFDPTTDDETLFAARLMAYASPKVDKLWGEFALRTVEFDNYMIDLRKSAGVPPVEIKGVDRITLEDKFDKWRQCGDKLKACVRHELM